MCFSIHLATREIKKMGYEDNVSCEVSLDGGWIMKVTLDSLEESA